MVKKTNFDIRLHDSIESAITCFWNRIANSFPEKGIDNHGKLSTLDNEKLYKVFNNVIKEWYKVNLDNGV